MESKIKNTIIGFLMGVCLFLMIGASDDEAMDWIVDGQIIIENNN